MRFVKYADLSSCSFSNQQSAASIWLGSNGGSAPSNTPKKPTVLPFVGCFENYGSGAQHLKAIRCRSG